MTENEIPITLAELPPYCSTCSSFHSVVQPCRGAITVTSPRRVRNVANDPNYQAEARRRQAERAAFEQERLENLRGTGILHCQRCGSTDWTGTAPANDIYYGTSSDQPNDNTVSFTFDQSTSDEGIDCVYCANCGWDAPHELEVTHS